jgi:phosphatidate cytidylyltransferase
VLTALALGPLLIGTILYPAFPPFAAVLALFLAVAAWEWAGLAGVRARVNRAIYTGAVLSLGGLLLLALNTEGSRLMLSAGASLLWVALTVLIARVQRGAEFPQWAQQMILALGGLVLLPFWLCICWLKLADYR